MAMKLIGTPRLPRNKKLDIYYDPELDQITLQGPRKRVVIPAGDRVQDGQLKMTHAEAIRAWRQGRAT